MASSGSVFSETLQTITTTKLEELAKQRIAFEEQHAALHEAIQAEKNPVERLILLVDGVKSSMGVKTTVRKNSGQLGQVIFGGTKNRRLETDLKNLDRFLEQARYDPSVSPKVLQDWEDSLLQYLAVQSSKYQYADLYGKLVTEWLSSDKSAADDGDVNMGGSFEDVPNAEKLESRAEWEKVVFEPAEIDATGLKDYLKALFITPSKTTRTAIDNLRKKVEDFEMDLSDSSPFDEATLRWVIQGLQGSDLLNNEKREALKDFLSNNVILGEIADVLNMRMASLNRWTWGDHVPLEQRRKLNGSYSIHMHEDLLQAIFLHYIGVKWSVFFKSAFVALRAEAWISNHTTIPKIDRKRREYYLGPQGMKTYDNLVDKRGKTYRNRYFAHQLLDYHTQGVEVQEGEEEAEYEDFAASAESMKRKRSSQQAAVQHHHHMPVQVQSHSYQAPAAQVPARPARAKQTARQHWNPSRTYGEPDDSDDGSNKKAKNPIRAKQDLLHLLSTEIIMNTRLHGQLNCFRSVFESWNPLLPHDTILTVLVFFGVSDKWLAFFRKFLQAPLKFTDDGPIEPRLRQRGTPGSHNLSDVFGEAVLFCLDFSVNQVTEGNFLHRLYDDIWFWSPDYEKCAKAWSAVLEFTKAMGVQLSDTKTGSVRVGVEAEVDDDDHLPAGQIRWGFLHLDPRTGRFEIDPQMVDSHVEELRKQLQGKSKSVIDWIQVWNSYAATFFSSNFGKAANCFGRQHVDSMLKIHRHIQESIFEGGNVVQFLKKTIEDRFGVQNVPDGFLFFPVELGGLDLKSPFIGLLQIRESVKDNPYDVMDDFEEAERDDYDEAKQRFDGVMQGKMHSKMHESIHDMDDEMLGNMYDEMDDERQLKSSHESWKPEKDADEFFSFEDYIKYREEFVGLNKADLAQVFRDLLRRPREESIDLSVQVKQAIDQLQGQSSLRGITANWTGMEPYWKWVAHMYGPEMVANFGGLNVVEFGLLPIGMVSMFRQRRTKWQG
ncbi:hypothetical protein EJ04DRAFT_582419 [Polyplosphaeria fusca]|uniref:Reverse transcriptase domain-containing protein n=1 Tax=Polyplosphaeria fusca TaxID=682080 RepID=A0A9P4QLD9_9PLEO|nr:hypothetical protein EJ04DRAFT_582419 [Polyplosphaeria fusca]